MSFAHARGQRSPVLDGVTSVDHVTEGKQPQSDCPRIRLDGCLANKSNGKNGSVYSSFEDADTAMANESSAVDGTTAANQLAADTSLGSDRLSGQRQLTVNPRQEVLYYHIKLV
jgi:hypothetical protein